MKAVCKIEGCTSHVYGRGLCSMHYQRWWKHGDPETMRRAPNGAGHVCKTNGYKLICINGIPQREHIAIAEKAMGRPLPPKAEVHHVDGDKANNAPTNLVVCPDRAYHMLLHLRQRAYDACGHSDWRKCWLCQKYDKPDNMKLCEGRAQAEHRRCRTQYWLKKIRARKEERRVSI